MGILNSVKKGIGVNPSEEGFDDEIIMHVNNALFTLSQLGVNSSIPFVITSDTEEWNDYITDAPFLSAIKLYIHNKVRMSFDPPANSFVLDAMLNQTAELEWRIVSAVEEKPTVVEEIGV